MTVVVATVQRGRHDHLRRQVAALALSREAPAAHVVVSMDEEPLDLPTCDVVHLPVEDGAELPIAAARNAAIRRAVSRHRAHLVILLDVDCLPSRDLVGRYREAARRRPRALLSGPVRYLPAGVPSEGDLPSEAELSATPPHPARPAPAAGELLEEARVELFWSLSFALAPELYERIGGFDEGYAGYGGEDTDFGQRARLAEVPLVWVGGAEAYHQHHPVSDPPVEHLVDIVRNARRYHARWGRWPMQGWLSAFAERGLVEWSEAGSVVRLTGRVPSDRSVDAPEG